MPFNAPMLVIPAKAGIQGRGFRDALEKVDGFPLSRE
jgi:hypothetical protein